MLLTAGERISMALLAMAIANLGRRGALVHRQPGRRHHRRRRTARPASSTSRRAASASALDAGRHRHRRRLPGRQPGHQGHHDARPRRLRHDGRRARRGARRRGLRDLHRRRRRLHRRPAHRADGPQARRHLLRGDARDGGQRRQGAAPALRRVRPPLQHPDPRALVVLAARRHLGHGRHASSEGEGRVEQAIISGVAHDRSEAKVTVVGVPDKPGEAAAIFRPSRTPRSTST